MMLINDVQIKFEIKLTVQEKFNLLSHWYRWFFENADDWSGTLGEDIAYLFGAIINDTFIEVDQNNKLFKLISKHNIPKTDRIWKFIQFPHN